MKDLMNYLDNSYSAFHAVKNLEEKLVNKGFKKLEENEKWNLEENNSYYVIRNTSSIIAFKVPEIKGTLGFNIVASHSDSPSYKIKPNATMKDLRNDYAKLNTETYGGPITYTWLDRPLGIAGRVFVENEKSLTEELVNLDDTIIIPSVAIHLNRSGEFNPNPQVDMLPLIGDANTTFDDMLKKQLNDKPIISTDLFLSITYAYAFSPYKSRLFISNSTFCM